ncbi:ABC transporter substrate-binding protein [Streptomyces griseocarneus]|uniref:ABC transporter substrate-binding protein n=1 Tax=Streptomyces griseocarneus TaxID=51201 RepID=UPI00167D7D7D|nr:sugar ABC transporter substrate-binding protein [Streptomyces griseocarneus]MBZ6472287.1 sugar ABC transporter substrate-binding protein [Streptomyces griseocarneus]GHG72813.1 sugar ABC transporter substrate-binding protein [Streptomyces griseocarneus]
MPISRRQLMAAGAGLAAAGGLPTACGSDTGRADGGSGPRLSQWYHQYGEPGTRQAVERYAAAYRKARVRVEWRPGNYDQQTAAALLGSSGPDVFEVNGPTIEQIQGGQVADLTELIKDVKDDFHPAVLAPKTYEGRVWGIPQLVDTQLLYYRKSLLRAAGLRPPATLDALIDAARELTTKRAKGLFLGNDGGASALAGTPLYAAGLSLVTPGGTVGFDEPAAARTLGKLHRLYADKSLLLGAPTDWANPAAFAQGLTAMQWCGLWALPQIAKALGDDFGVLPFPPDGPAGRPAVPVGAWTAAVSARGGHREAAEAFVRWLWIERTDLQKDFALSYGFHIPARASLAATADRLRQGAAAEAVRFTEEHGFAQPLLWTAASQTAYLDALNRVIKEGADPGAQLRAVVRTAGAELRRVQKRR